MNRSVLVFGFFAAFAVFAAHAGRVISINIAGDGPKMSEQSGVAPGLSKIDDATAASWNDITAGSGEGGPQALRAWDSANGGVVNPEGLSATWKFSGVWGTGESPDLYRRRWINGSGAGTWSMTISGIPYEEYDIICYCNWDGARSGGSRSPVTVNGEDWTCGGDGVGYMGSGDWGVTTSDLNAPSKFGDNAMRIENLTGDTLTLFMQGPRYCNVCAVQIVDRQQDPPVVEEMSVISINFAGDYAPVSGIGRALPGLSGFAGIPAASWNDITTTESEGPVALKAWDFDKGEFVSDLVKATWKIAGIGHTGGSPDPFRHAYANAADSGAWSLDITGIPFETYGVILYSNWRDNPSYGWDPLSLNGQKWTCGEDGVGVKGSDRWGTRVNDSNDPSIYGQNAMRVSGLTGSKLTIASGDPWCNASAIQIVDESPIRAEGDISTSEVNARAGGNPSVILVLPEGAKLTLTKDGLVCKSLRVSCAGDCVIDAAYNPADPAYAELFNATMAKIDLSGVRGLVFHGWKATARVISLNFNSEDGRAMSNQPGFAGAFAGEEILASSWNDIPASPKEGTISPRIWNGGIHQVEEQVEGLSLSWMNGGSYASGSSPDIFRRGWISNGWELKADLPADFGPYDIICYFNWDGKNDQFRSIQINGAWYASDENGLAFQTDNNDYRWGSTTDESGNPRVSEPATLGINAFRLKNQTAKHLTISQGQIAWLRYLCAVQIVESVSPAPGLMIMFR